MAPCQLRVAFCNPAGPGKEVDATTIVLGTPTVHSAAHIASLLGPKAKYATVIGSCGWGGKAVEKLVAQPGDLKLELFDPLMCKGMPRDADYQALDRLAVAIAMKHEGLASHRRNAAA